jgi:hypothetical protein
MPSSSDLRVTCTTPIAPSTRLFTGAASHASTAAAGGAPPSKAPSSRRHPSSACPAPAEPRGSSPRPPGRRDGRATAARRHGSSGKRRGRRAPEGPVARVRVRRCPLGTRQRGGRRALAHGSGTRHVRVEPNSTGVRPRAGARGAETRSTRRGPGPTRGRATRVRRQALAAHDALTIAPRGCGHGCPAPLLPCRTRAGPRG